MKFNYLRKFLRRGALAALSILLMAKSAAAEPFLFSESWESYTNGVKPYGDWQLDKGGWAHISTNGINGGKYFHIGAKIKSRLRHEVDLTDCNDIVLQGWFYDSGDASAKSSLGFVDTTNSMDALIRIGSGTPNLKTYAVVYYDRLQSDKVIIIDTGLPFEKGWHFMRLDIFHDRSVTYRVWNAAQTIEKSGSFGWVFDRARLKYLVVGSVLVTPGEVGWDEIKTGSLEQVGPPPQLPIANQ